MPPLAPRAASAALTRIADLLQLRGENAFKTRAYENAARALVALDTDDLAPLLARGELEGVPGLGPATLGVVRELAEEGESSLLARLEADTPRGLLDLVGVPGLSTSKIHTLYTALGVDSLDALEAVASDGRLAGVKGFGAKTAEKIARGVRFARASAGLLRYPQGAAAAAPMLAEVRRHPDVIEAMVAGELRRRLEVVSAPVIVAAVRAAPDAVAEGFGRAPGVQRAEGAGPGAVALTYADGARLTLRCAAPDDYAVALWAATGSDAHLAQVDARLTERGLTRDGYGLRDAGGARIPVPDEAGLYAAAGLAFVVPELREGRGEVEAAATGALPALVEPGDVRGILHCHSTYSDGTASIEEMADAARARGLAYLGITDHSQSAAYAGGLSPARVREQHREIDALNARYAAEGVAFRVLKGIECDILADGALDYDDATLARFDYVIGSVHSRFNMEEAEMTARIVRAVENPFLTILGHPTGRLLLARESYPVDIPAVLDAAARAGACVEVNADPHRLDLDWRELAGARTRGLTIEIGPDAHAPGGLDNVEFGVATARKGWVTPGEVLNARTADEVLAFARRKREGAPRA